LEFLKLYQEVLKSAPLAPIEYTGQLPSDPLPEEPLPPEPPSEVTEYFRRATKEELSEAKSFHKEPLPHQIEFTLIGNRIRGRIFKWFTSRNDKEILHKWYDSYRTYLDVERSRWIKEKKSGKTSTRPLDKSNGGGTGFYHR
jgi:hypothetical protein